jgi:hypothetical protein
MEPEQNYVQLVYPAHNGHRSTGDIHASDQGVGQIQGEADEIV